MKDRKQLAIEINESTLWAAPKSDRGKHPDFAKIKNDILYYLESLSNFFYDEYEVSFSELCYPMFEGKNNEISPIIQCMLSYDPKKTKFFIKFFSFQMHQLAKRIVIQKILQQEYIGEVTEKESDEIQNIRRDVDKLRVITKNSYVIKDMLQRYYQYKGLTINELKEKVHHDLSELGYPDELIDNLLSSLLRESEDKESAENLNNCSSVGDMSKKLHNQLSELGYPDELIDNLLSLELIDNLLSLYSKYLSLYSKYLIALKDKEISEKKNALCNLKDMKKKIQEELCNLNDMKKKIQEELCNPKDSDNNPKYPNKLIKDLLSLLPAKKIISDKQIEKAMIPPINRVDTYSSTADGKEVCRFDTYTYNNESLNELDLQKILNVSDQVYKTSPCKHKPVLTLELSTSIASYFSLKEASIAFFDISTNADIAIDDALPQSSILDYIKNLAFFDESVFNEYIIKSRTVMKKEIANILKTKHLLTATDKSKVLAKLSKHNIFDNKEIAYRIGIADVSVCRIKNQFLEKIESQAKALDSKCLAYIKALTKKKKEHSNNYAK